MPYQDYCDECGKEVSTMEKTVVEDGNQYRKQTCEHGHLVAKVEI